jgi:glycosyltransferase involved in cell wall biosynthesis
LLETKGILEYCQAAKQLHSKHPETIFNVLGGFHPNPAKLTPTYLDALFKECGVTYLGEATSSLPALQDAHCIVLPSYREGTPRALLEALAVGRPIITTDAPGCRETVMNGQNGYLVPVQSTSDLATAMEKILNHPDLEAMAQASHQLASDKFDVHKVNAEILKTLG